MAEIVFWVSLGGVLGTYVGYPLALWAWARLAPKPVARRPVLPTVSVVLAVRDEADRIAARLADLLALDYPPDRLSVIVVSDGSTDGTPERAREAAAGDPRVTVIALDRPTGKAAALNAGVAKASGEIVVFADARQRFRRSAVRRLVENFADPSVGVASGRLVLEDTEGVEVAEGLSLYWRYELWLRARESAVGSTLGATGAIYAIRRHLYQPIAPDTILDDVAIPMLAVLAGARSVLDERAIAIDRVAPSGNHELARKVRTLYGNYQLLARYPALLSRRNPVLGRFLAHKVARLAVPLWLALIAVSTVFLDGAYAVFGLLHWAAYGAALVGSAADGRRGRRRGPVARVASAAYVFLLLNWAALLALVRFLRGDRAVWVRTRA
ncbi:MAG TPA: glycosyltransferase family 2 protein [Thermodesulfobacteriota bacterium]